MHRIERIAIAGIPNCGKTTLFNTLTGSSQRVGNWPGVTVEKISGNLVLKNTKVELADLPGTYDLSPDSEDQKVAERVIRNGEYDLILNVVDASNLTRNLYLTMDLKERTNQIIVLLNMMDVAENEGLEVDINALSKSLGLPVIPVVAVDRQSVRQVADKIEELLPLLPEHDSHASSMEVMDTVRKYAAIDTIYSKSVREKREAGESFTNRVDNIVMNHFTAIPIFFVAMFITFWFAIGVGSIFIDFFDIMGGLIFVDIPTAILQFFHSPQWLTVILAGGIGSGIQTVGTFIPVVFFMFMALAILEDLGYMARVGVIADRFMRKIGLPGSAFIPMIVGFGCTVPAVMAARTMTNKRDRFMTIFMAPFMSCGARLPVYALFCAALFGSYSGLAVFLIYLIGLFMAIFTGFLLKNTLFKGSPSYFIMDLPHYHIPQAATVFKSAWLRMKNFLRKAGIIVVCAVSVLSILNSLGIDHGKVTFGNEDSQSSFLAYTGKAISPIFEPIGINKGNWPASVALFTGLFAKEAIVGTVNSLYSSMDMSQNQQKNTAAVKETPSLDIEGSIIDAFASIGKGFAGIVSSFDILGVGIVTEDKDAISEEIGADSSILTLISQHFTVFSAFAYLLFVLMYFPCLAVIGAARQEMGGLYAAIMAAYATLLAWSVATLFYQIVEGHHLIYICFAFLVLAFIYGALFLLGKNERFMDKQPILAPPMHHNKKCCS